jgi:hypothetical protein
MFSTGRFRLALCVGLLLFRAGLAAAQVEASLYRVFLRDGTTLLSYGEFARVSDRVVVSVPIGEVTAADPALHLVSIPSDSVDWERTDAYADSVRAARYASTRGPDDFAQLGNGVTIALTDIALTQDPARKIAMAAEARQNVTKWVAEHYGYRAEDVARMASMFDEVIAATRSASGAKNVDLSLIANLAAPPTAPLLPAPTLQESVEQALRAAVLAPDATERVSLLRAVDRVLADTPRDTASWSAPIRARLAGTLAIEERASRGYEALTLETLRAADRQVRLADVTGVERVIRRALSEDDRLGQRRPQEMASLLAMLDSKLDAARRLRLARDSWAARVEDWRRYRLAIAEPLELMRVSRGPLDEIRRLAGPSRVRLDRLVMRTARALALASAAAPPAEGLEAHGHLKNAIQLASRAAETRRRAVISGTMDIAWEASAAAAGAVVLLDRATDALKILDAPPKAPR